MTLVKNSEPREASAVARRSVAEEGRREAENAEDAGEVAMCRDLWLFFRSSFQSVSTLDSE